MQKSITRNCHNRKLQQTKPSLHIHNAFKDTYIRLYDVIMIKTDE